jgi:hypothetical protein
MQHLYLSCLARYASVLAEELTDLFAANKTATILSYGITPKQPEGFVVTAWPSGIPPKFLEKLKRDSNILEYVVYDDTPPSEDSVPQ